MIIEGTMKKPEKLEALNEKTLTEFLKGRFSKVKNIDYGRLINRHAKRHSSK